VSVCTLTLLVDACPVFYTRRSALAGRSSASAVQALYNRPPASAVHSLLVPDGMLHSPLRHQHVRSAKTRNAHEYGGNDDIRRSEIENPIRTARKYGPYLRPVYTSAFLTPIHTARTYGPYVRVVRTGLKSQLNESITQREIFSTYD